MCAKHKAPSSPRNKQHISPLSQPAEHTRVLYIHPAKQGLDFQSNENSGRPYGLIPVGVAALINVLRENGIDVRGVNFPLEKQLNSTFNLKNWLKSHARARVILIDLHWYEHCYGAINAAKVCKEVLPEIQTVLGGLTASGFSREILENFPEVDFIIRGDAEKPLLTLVQRLLQGESQLSLVDIPNLSYRDGTNIVENPCTYCAATQDLDKLNFVDIDFLDHYKEYYVHEYIVTDLAAARRALEINPFRGRWICTARGCHYECSYCGGCKSAHKLLAGREGIVTRSPAAVVDDLVRLEKAGVIQASLSYDISELGDEYWQEFFTKMKASGVKIGLYNEFFQLPKPEFIEEFAKNSYLPHSSVALSPLSGSERVRRLNGKHFSNNEFFDTLDFLSRYNIFILVYFSLNLPGETEAAFYETLDLAHTINDFYPSSLLKMLNTVHTLDPFSPMNVHPEKYGIETGMSTFMEYYTYCQNTQLAVPEARTGMFRGYRLLEHTDKSLEIMADAWDTARQGKESSWWPIPPSW